MGHAFALAVSEQILTRRYPDHNVSFVRADTALRAGWTLTSLLGGELAEPAVAESTPTAPAEAPIRVARGGYLMTR
ncbi:hypothetical protein ACFWWT_37830 [Streptomyces sp. NPDC058676]|uniref:hypothetical protein n=1 Tax=unclassified Streptomyces TaxID=2593676 RepID=UPI00364EB556